MAINNDGPAHRPVLYQEIIHALQPVPGGFYVDGTLGAGGHAWGLLKASAPDGRLLGLDVDPQALSLARARLAEFGQRAIIVQASYAQLGQQLVNVGQTLVHGMVLDLGLSSMQLDTPQRGFSFQVDAPLDMRFDPANPVQAADLVNSWSEADLRRILYQYGEEERAPQIARAIVRERPLNTTGDLAGLVLRVVGRGRSRSGRSLHPATRTFQALRIAVNRELETLETVLPQAVAALIPGGRLAIISFHSLEDRIVKQYFRQESRDCLCPPRQPVCTCGHKALIRELSRRPVSPSEEELAQNPRSRSAHLRVAERLDTGVHSGT